MSANDVLDVLNIQRNESAHPKKKQKVESQQPQLQKGGLARELYNLLGPNTPPVNMSLGNSKVKDRKHMRVSPWTRMSFKPNKRQFGDKAVTLHHWEKGSRELLEQERASKPYFFDKFLVSIDIPDMVDEETYDRFMKEIKDAERERIEAAKKEENEQIQNEKEQKDKSKEPEKSSEEPVKQEKDPKGEAKLKLEVEQEKLDTDSDKEKPKKEAEAPEWTYEETKLLFEYCKCFELKWHIIKDRFPAEDRSLEELKEQFYRISSKILKDKGTGNPHLLDSLDNFSSASETDRKQYLESLLKRTPAEIAEEESLVIEARRFELAAKKMLVERSHLLTLLDSPQSSLSVQQYQSFQGLTNLYNNLMIMDKNQKKKLMLQRSTPASEPVPPAIPLAASSSFKKDKTFQTHLQQYLSGILKQQQSSGQLVKGEPNAIQQLLSKRLTTKEEEAYGLHYHANERLTPGVILRSAHRLPGLQQRQSVFKSVNAVLQELDIPTVGGTTWKPVMPTRKTMAKYDELIRVSVALLDVKKGKDKLEAEVELIKSQRSLE